MCQSQAEGGARCGDAARYQRMTAADFAPPVRDGVPQLQWVGEDLGPMWKNYPDSEVCAGLKTIERHVQDEPAATYELQNVADAVGGRLEGLEFRVKSPSSLVRKVHDDLAEEAKTDPGGKNATPQAVAGKLKDVLRYTVAHDDHAGLKQTVEQTARGLQEQGWSIVDVKSRYAENAPYKGLHLIGQDARGVTIEVQVHSTESLAAKNQTHGPYEVMRDREASKAERRAAAQRCREIFSAVPTPSGLDDMTEIAGCPVRK